MNEVVAFDFDATLNTYSGDFGSKEVPPPREKTRWLLEEVEKLGFRVVIHSCGDTPSIMRWLDEHNLRDLVYQVTNQKPQAFAYIDDRGLTFNGDEVALLETLKNFKPHWK